MTNGKYEDYVRSPAKSPIVKFLFLHPTEEQLLWVVDVILESHLPYKWLAVQNINQPTIYISPHNVQTIHHPALLFYKWLVGRIRSSVSKLNPQSVEYRFTMHPPEVIIDLINMMYYYNFTVNDSEGWHRKFYLAMLGLSTPIPEYIEQQLDGSFLNTITREERDYVEDDDIYYQLGQTDLVEAGEQIIPFLNSREKYFLKADEILVYSTMRLRSQIISKDELYKVEQVKIPYFGLDWSIHDNILEGVRIASQLVFSGKPQYFMADPGSKTMKIRRSPKAHSSDALVLVREHFRSCRPMLMGQLSRAIEEGQSFTEDWVYRIEPDVVQETVLPKKSMIITLNPNDYVLQEILATPPEQSTFSAIFQLSDQFVYKYMISTIKNKSKLEYSPVDNIISGYKQFCARGLSDLYLSVKVFYRQSTETEVQSAKSFGISRSQSLTRMSKSVDSEQMIPLVADSNNRIVAESLQGNFALITEGIVKFYINEVEIPQSSIESLPDYKLTITDFFIGQRLRIDGLTFEISQVDGRTAEWLASSLLLVDRLRRRIDRILVEQGTPQQTCRYRYFQHQDLEGCRVSLRETSDVLLLLFGAIRDKQIKLVDLK